MFPNSSGFTIHGGTFNSSINRTSKGMDILMEWVATDALHSSKELYDPPKCHPHTRVAVLDDIMQWVNESDSTREDFMMWLFGAGAAKSAIAKQIAEIAAERDLLVADFFFSKSSPTRNTTDRLIATLAYQLTLSIPNTRSYIEDAIERDRAIFNKNILIQIDTLLIRPFQSISSTQIVPSQKLIIIDGLDECNDSKAQVAILEAISRSVTRHKLPIIFLVASRPEPDIVTSFNCNEPLKFIHRRLALDDIYQLDDDIRLFLSDKSEDINCTHPLRSITWPNQEILDTLVTKLSGQSINAPTLLVPEGTYNIGNVEFSNFASISDGNKGSVVASNDDSFSGSKWNIVPLAGNRYYIQNYQHPSLYAWSKPFSERGEQVFVNSFKAEWTIKETLKKGLYTISPADKEDLFWGLEDQQPNTPVELGKGQNAKQNHWVLRRGHQIVETIINNLQLSLEWMDTTNKLTEHFHAHLSGKLKGSDLPPDASISFPKALDIIWNNRIVGSAVLDGTYGPTQADLNTVNMDITPTRDYTVISDYVRAILGEESITFELSVDEINVTAGGKKYNNVAANFRKSVITTGFNSFQNQLDVCSVRITGSDPQGVGLNSICRIEIRNPTNISVLIEDFPVDVYYEGEKIAKLVMPAFKLQGGSTGSVLQKDVEVQFKPDDPKAMECIEFISKYITTNQILPIYLSLSRIVITLPLTTVTIPSFFVTCTVQGLNKQFVRGCTGYVGLVHAPLTRTIDFAFEFENPIDTPLTIKFFQGKAKMNKRLLCQFEKHIKLDIPARQTVSSAKIQKATLTLSPIEMVTFLGKKSLILDVEVERAAISIGSFTLLDMSFVLEGIDAKLKWSI